MNADSVQIVFLVYFVVVLLFWISQDWEKGRMELFGWRKKRDQAELWL
jgi:hypothetical protein